MRVQFHLKEFNVIKVRKLLLNCDSELHEIKRIISSVIDDSEAEDFDLEYEEKGDGERIMIGSNQELDYLLQVRY